MVIFVSIVLFEWFRREILGYFFLSGRTPSQSPGLGACLYWQNGYGFFKVMANGFKRGLKENFSPASELGSLPAFGKGAFKGHSHSGYPAIQIFVLGFVIVFSDGSGVQTMSF